MLSECLDSVYALSLSADERDVIIVNDGSKESPAQMMKERYADAKIIEQSNQGLSAARNNALAIATGDYVQFLDADDYLLEYYDKVIEKARTGEYDIIRFGFTRDSEKTIQRDTFSKAVTGREQLNAENISAAACLYLFRRETLQSLHFEQGIYHEDELFTPQLFFRAEKIIRTETTAYYYRLRTESITTSRSAEKEKKRFDDFEHVMLQLSSINEQTAGAPYTRRINQLTMDYVYNIICRARCSGLKERTKRLRDSGLFPLPLKHYTTKYLLFALLTRIL